MRKLTQLLCLSFALLCLNSTSAVAGHLVGGSLTYDHLRTTINGDQQYLIQLSMYRDADIAPGNPNVARSFDDSVTIGVYEDDVDLRQLKSITIAFDSADEVKVKVPSGGGDCSFSPQVDFRQYVYQDTITLPPSQFGYHLGHPRCCRNRPANLLPSMGQFYYAYIPPTKRKNTSPDFNSVPAPYICKGDTIDLSYQTFEPDGDSLAYKLVRPYNCCQGPGASPKPGPPNTLQLPLQKVQYRTGYAASRPFGSNGLATINSSSGVATLSASSNGRYAIAVEIQEFRDGQLISSTRRDIQIIVIDCPPNDPPKDTVASRDSSGRAYQVAEGSRIEFEAVFVDSDDMSVDASGGIFENVRQPRAQLSSNKAGDTLKAAFSWQTQCYHGRKPPYVFNFEVQDDGCPPKEAISGYQVNVVEYQGGEISGPDSACRNSTSTYQVDIGKTGDDSVIWRIPGGTIVSSEHEDSVEVRWDSSGVFSVEAITANINRCSPDTAVMQVAVFEPPYGAAGPDTTLCGGDTIRLGPSPAPADTRYQWQSASGITASPDTANPLYTRTNSSGNPTTLFLKPEVEQNACRIRDTVQVTIDPKPEVSAIQGDSTPCLEEAITYKAKSTNGRTYQWFADGGTPDATDDTARVTWQTPDSGRVAALTTNQYGCSSDTAAKVIDVINPTIDTILGTKVVCPNSQSIRYWVDSQDNSNYQWETGRGAIASGQGNGQLRVNWGDSGRGYVRAREITKEGCISDSFQLPVQIAYQLETSPIFGDTFLCEESTQTYEVRYTNGSSYEWWVDNGQGTPQTPGNATQVTWGAAGTGKLEVLETSYDSVNDKVCKGDTVTQTVVLNRLPEPGPIQGPDSVCSEDTVTYHVDGFASSGFEWRFPADKAERVRKQGDSLFLYVKEAGDITLRLTEVTKDSCLSPVKRMPIRIKQRPQTRSIEGKDTVCLKSGLRETYRYPGTENSRFDWQVEGGTIEAGAGSSTITAKWLSHGNNQLTVREVALNGCSSEPVSTTVTVDKLSVNVERATTLPDQPDQVRLEWKIDKPSYFTTEQAVKRRGSQASGFQTLADGLPSTKRNYRDQAASPGEQAYTYSVQTFNLCRDLVSSEQHRTSWLKGEKQDERSLKLNWTAYQGWESAVRKYEILRRTTSQDREPDYEVVEEVTGDQQTFKLESPAAGATQCYRIRAVRNSDGTFSWSNELCRDFPAYVYIPDAFTPWDDNGINDTFRITTANLKQYKMEIYNRWGAKVFETSDPESGWDGTHNGEPAPAGIYVVKVRFRGNNATQERTATLELLR